ncbi:MAG: hypothetical protein MJ102_06650 [Clostridia bacterium]|nr:hypothetical protein [Clostridia bacterium]
MKIHTAEKYIRSLPTAPDRANVMRARIKALISASFRTLGLRVIRPTVIGIAGRESEYAADIVSRGLVMSGSVPAVADMDPEAALSTCLHVSGKAVGDDEAAELLTAIRKESMKLIASDPAAESGFTAFEIRMIFMYCACCRAGTTHVIVKLDTDKVTAFFSALLPKAKIMLLTPISQEGLAAVRAMCGLQTGEIISSPQNEETNRGVSALCADLNCSHNHVVRSQIEASASGVMNIAFTYKGIKTTARTCLASSVWSAAAALEVLKRTLRAAHQNTEKIMASAVASSTKCRGTTLSISPAVIGVTVTPSQMAEDTNLRDDVSLICKNLGTCVNVITSNKTAGYAMQEEFSGAGSRISAVLAEIAGCGVRQGKIIVTESPEDEDKAMHLLFASGTEQTDSKNDTKSTSEAEITENMVERTGSRTEDELTVVIGERELVCRIRDLAGKYGEACV